MYVCDAVRRGSRESLERERAGDEVCYISKCVSVGPGYSGDGRKEGRPRSTLPPSIYPPKCGPGPKRRLWPLHPPPTSPTFCHRPQNHRASTSAAHQRDECALAKARERSTTRCAKDGQSAETEFRVSEKQSKTEQGKQGSSRTMSETQK